MHPPNTDIHADSDIHKKFQKREPLPSEVCELCPWHGSNLAKHKATEHDYGILEEEEEDKKPFIKVEDAIMQFDASAVLPINPPARRRIPRGPGRKVEHDPDFVRGGPKLGSNNPSGPPKLFDHRSDVTKGGQPLRTIPHHRNQNAPPRNPQRSSHMVSSQQRHSQAPVQGQSNDYVLAKKLPVAGAMTSAPSAAPQQSIGEEERDVQPELILQPETRPISQEQLVAEVKGIYAGLVMVEAKCIEVDSKQAAAVTQGIKEAPRLNNDQWQALIALHRTLLHEHHDFFLASQHPSAAPSLKKLATKYAMPARMWRHGIHSFLELLRHRLPDSFEHMLAFIYLAYSMMALLYETVPAFADTWVECLGDLGRYRMAIEEGDPRDREVWMNVSRFWYSKGTDRLPHVGRLYHHLAILARPNILQQLFFYCKALAVFQPFSAARESILTLFDPTALKEQDVEGNQSADATFVLLHSICFTFVNQDAFETKKDEYLDLLDKKIGITKLKFKIPGVYIAVCGVASIFQYNGKEGRLKMATIAKENRKATDEAEANYKAAQSKIIDSLESTVALPPGPIVNDYEPKKALSVCPPGLDPTVNVDISLTHAQDLAFSILSLALDRGNDAAVQPHIHVWLVFINYLKDYPEGMALVVKAFPWEQLAQYATGLIKKRRSDETASARVHDSNVFPVVMKGFRPLPEEYMMRGLEIARRYFPHGYFNKVQVDDDERLIELPSMNSVREERMLWLLIKFARFGPWIVYDQSRATFTVSTELKALLQENNNQTTYMQEPNTMVDDYSDVEMEMSPDTMAEDDDESPDEVDNPEISQLLAQRRALRKQLNEPAVSFEDEKQTKTTFSFSAESFKPNFTIVVVDTNSILKHPDTFKKMIDSNEWSIVLPYSVITELQGLRRNDGKVSETSEAALKFLEQALQEKRNLRIITAKGSQINNIAGQFYELIDYSDESRKNLDDIIIETAKAQGEIAAKRMPIDGVTRSVVLITDDSIMRVKAITRGVASVATKQWIKYITPVNEDTHKKIANAYLSLAIKYPRIDKERVYQAAKQAAGDESCAANILKRDRNISAKKRKARAYIERQQQHGDVIN